MSEVATRRRWVMTAAVLAALTGLGVAVVPGNSPAQAQSATGEAVQEGLDGLVEAGFPAAMASVRDADGRSEFYSSGVGDVATGEPVPEDGQLRIASATKMFTATVVLQLVGEGKIDLDASVASYLPNLLRGEGIDGNDITVRQLLQHTGGLPDYTDFAQDFPKIQHLYLEPRQLIDMALAKPAVFPPGTSWRYSNTGYITLGLIVQKVTGRPISEQVTQRVIDRVGLEHTYWPGVGEQEIREDHAHGYLPANPGEPRVDISVLDPSWGWAAGQLIATPSDLNTFLAALLGGELLAPEQLEEMKTVVEAPGFPENWRYGLGLLRIELSCGVAWGHGGDIDGTETRDAIMADGRAATVAVTALPTEEQGRDMPVDAVLDTALCAGR